MVSWYCLWQGETAAEAAKKFAIAHKLDKDTMQSVYYFLNRKACLYGLYKRELGTYNGLNYAGAPMPVKIYEDSNVKGLAEFLAIKLELSAESMDALIHDLEVWMVDRVQLRMPVDLKEQGIGMTYVVVKRHETVAEAMKSYALSLNEDFGFNLSEQGVKDIAAGIKEKLASEL